MMPRFFRRRRTSAPAGRPSYRPRLDPLEDRSLLSVMGHAGPAAPPALGLPVSPTAPQTTNFAPSRAVTAAPDVPVSVVVNSPAWTTDLNALFTRTGGVDAALAPGLRFTIVGNTNPDLVTSRLSDDDLVLTFAANQRGTAKVTVSATDGAGASVRVTFVVTVGAAPLGP